MRGKEKKYRTKKMLLLRNGDSMFNKTGKDI